MSEPVCYLCGDPRTCYRGGVPLCNRCALGDEEPVKSDAA